MDVLGQRHLDRLGAVLGLGDDLQVRLGVEHLAQAGAHDRVIVGDQDAGDERDRHQTAPAGDLEPHLEPPPAAVA